MTRTIPLCLAMILSACSIDPFVPVGATSGAPRPMQEVLVDNYMRCAFMFVGDRLSYPITAYELADAAIGACKAELAEIRSYHVEARLLSYRAAEDLVRGLERDTRDTLTTAVIEARNKRQPIELPSHVAT